MSISLDDFKDIEFPYDPNIVYIICFRLSGKDICLYVGQTTRNIGRFGDYIKANFTAPADFKVGEAIKYLHSLGIYVGVRYKETTIPREEERVILSKLGKQYQLLNDLQGYDYRRANEEEERLKIRRFVDGILARWGQSH